MLAGQHTQAYNFTATPGSGTFTTAVTFACSNLPDPTVTCSFNPTQIAAGGGATPVVLTITTAGPNSGQGGAARRAGADKRSPWLPLTLPIAGIVFAGIVGRKISKRSAIVWLCVSLLLIGLMVACGGGSSGPPPPPVVSVTVSPSNPNVLLGGTQAFTATVHNATGDVTWQVNGVNGGSAATGTIVSTGTDQATYTAPTTGTTPSNFTVKAILQSDTTKSGSTTVNIPAISVTVSPNAAVNLYANVAGNHWPAGLTRRSNSPPWSIIPPTRMSHGRFLVALVMAQSTRTACTAPLLPSPTRLPSA